MKTYRAALVGCSRMGAFIDNEMPPTFHFPYSHAAGYEACDRTELVAGSDLRPEVLEKFGERYKIAKEHLYTDYRAMIEREKPDIVSVATQPHHRTEPLLFAAEHGVRALYPEKPLCASMDEARRIVEAVEKHKIALNMGTNRRWAPGFNRMREFIASGELGALKSLIIYSNGTLFNTSTHWFDTVIFLNGDTPITWCQAHLPKADEQIRGHVVVAEPPAEGMFGFENGVTCYALLTPRPYDIEAICENGRITAMDNDDRLEVRRFITDKNRARNTSPPENLPFTERSSTLGLIEDLVHALDTGEPTKGGVRVAYANIELIFGFIQSQVEGGKQIHFPLKDNKLRFDPSGYVPRQPKFQRA